MARPLGPDKLVPGGRYSIDFAVDVAISKFADHLPLERQLRQMARDSLALDSSTLWEQTWFLSQHLMETYEANADYAGFAICDGYKAYDVLAREREGSDLTLAHC